MPRRGCTVSEVRIIPVEYSEVMASAPNTDDDQLAEDEADRLRWVASNHGPRTGRDTAARQASAPMPMVTTTRASSVQ